MSKKKLLFPFLLISILSITSCNKGEVGVSIFPPLFIYEPIETPTKRMPAEFEPVEKVMVCYPNNMPLSAYKAIAENNELLVLVNFDKDSNSRIEEARADFIAEGVNLDNVTFINAPLGADYSYWVRDFSPFFVFNERELTTVDFIYNRGDRVEQNDFPHFVSDYLHIPCNKMNIVHTGGNLMQDGRGTAFSDDLVIKENSNNKEKVLSQMKEYTGTDNYVITIDPQDDYIAHIDCWAKIVAPDKIIVAKMPNTDYRYSFYEQVAETLANTKCSYGYNYRIYRVEEMGGKIVTPYTNSLIANNYVYMPLGDNDELNQKAIDVYKEALPNYTVVGIEGFDASTGLEFLNTDALHCRTHEIPNKEMLFIDSREVYRGEVELQDKYLIKTNVVSYGEFEINVTINYSINGSEYTSVNMNNVEGTTNYIYFFENLKSGDDVKYYIEAKDEINSYNVDPTCKDKDPHHFIIK